MPRLLPVAPRIRHVTFPVPTQRPAIATAIGLLTTLRPPPAFQPTLSSLSSPAASPRHFGDLTKLAHSRSANFLSKKNDIPYIEYSSNAELIRSSEVDPFAPAPGASKEAIRRYQARTSKRLQQQEAAAAAAALRDPYVVQTEKIRELSARLDELQARMRTARFLGILGVVFTIMAMLYFGGEDIKRFFYETETAQNSKREKDQLETTAQPTAPHEEDELLPLTILGDPEKATTRPHKPFYRSLFWTSGSAGR